LKIEIAEKIQKLRIPTPNSGQYAIETDASNQGLGAVLLFRFNGEESYMPAAYLSHKFDEAQKNYNNYEKELLAGKKATEKWSHYLLGRQFDWITDNSCVNWAHKIKARKAKIAKWLAEIGDFDFKTILKASNKMVISDCLSRQFGNDTSPTVNMISGKELKNLQDNEHNLMEIGRYVAVNRWPNLRSKTLDSYYKNRQQITRGPDGELGIKNGDFKVFPPEFLIEDILKEYHDKCGHPGVSQTLEKISRKYFIPNLRSLVTDYLKSCDSCQRIKPCTNPLNAPLGHVQPPSQPFERFAIDLVGPLPFSAS
jgi:hypothetical protein